MNEWTLLFAAIAGFGVSFLLGYPIIPYLRKLKFGQKILDIGPNWHKSKEGTPTMGGVLIIAGVLVAVLASFAVSALTDGNLLFDSMNANKMTHMAGGLGLALGMGLVGFLDDYIKVVKKRNLGLTARQKTFLQLLVAAAYLVSLALGGLRTTWLPFLGDVDVTVGLGLLFWPIALLFIYGFTNAVNLTDGIDGLAAAVTMVVCCGFMLASGLMQLAGINTLAAATAGACMGFWVWNAHPAKVFMGNTGSLFLGGMVVALAFGIGRPVLLILAGIVYLIEAFSVMLQVAVYKKTKKRIFKMAPLHHHFELSGYSENKIVILFSCVTILGCGATVLAVLFA